MGSFSRKDVAAKMCSSTSPRSKGRAQQSQRGTSRRIRRGREQGKDVSGKHQSSALIEFRRFETDVDSPAQQRRGFSFAAAEPNALDGDAARWAPMLRLSRQRDYFTGHLVHFLERIFIFFILTTGLSMSPDQMKSIFRQSTVQASLS